MLVIDIDTHLLWLEGRVEYALNFGNDVFGYLEDRETEDSDPVWLQIIKNGSSQQTLRLLKVIQALEPSYQREIFFSQANEKERFPDRLAAFANGECLIVFFAILKNFTSEDVLALLGKKPGATHFSFAALIAGNLFGRRSLSPFFDFLESVDPVDRLEILKSQDRRGVSFIELVASNQTSIYDNGFQSLLEALKLLRKQLKLITSENIRELSLMSLVNDKLNQQDFFQMIVARQPIESIFHLFLDGWISMKNGQYFASQREELWAHVMAQPQALKVLVLSELYNQTGAFASLFCKFKGMTSIFLQWKWRAKIKKECEAIGLQEFDAGVQLCCTSYQTMSASMPIARAVRQNSLGIEVSASHQPTPSAPLLQGFVEVPLLEPQATMREVTSCAKY